MSTPYNRVPGTAADPGSAPSAAAKAMPADAQAVQAAESTQAAVDPASLPGGVFVAEQPVRFADCDPAGIVFFPNYFRMLNAVVEDWLAALGHPWTGLVVRDRVGTPTAQLDTGFRKPSFFGDTLTFELRVEKLGKSSLVLAHVARCGDEIRFTARQVLVATSLDTHKAIPWPDGLRTAIEIFKERP